MRVVSDDKQVLDVHAVWLVVISIFCDVDGGSRAISYNTLWRSFT